MFKFSRMLLVALALVLVFAAGVMVAGRSGGGSGEALQQRTLARTGATEAGYEAALNQHEFRRLWESLAYPPDRPEVDFTREWVLGAFLGRKPTGGFGVTIDRVEQRDRQVMVQVSTREPGSGDFVTQEITYPGHVVALERPAEPGAYTVVIRNAAGEEQARLRLEF